MDACICGTSLLMVFSSLISLHHQPPEYIKTLYLFYLYVNAPRHSVAPSPLTVLCTECRHLLCFLSLQLISLWMVM